MKTLLFQGTSLINTSKDNKITDKNINVFDGGKKDPHHTASYYTKTKATANPNNQKTPKNLKHELNEKNPKVVFDVFLSFINNEKKTCRYTACL